MTFRASVLQALAFGRDAFADYTLEPQRVNVQGWQSDHPYLSRAVQELRPRLVVEIGVWKGASVITLAKAMQAAAPGGVVVAVDTWLGSSEHYIHARFAADLDPVNGYPTLYKTFLANMAAANVTDVVVPLPLDSLNSAELMRSRKLQPQVIHIDAGHDYASVMADLRCWWSLLAPGGVLIGDDYHPRPRFLKKPKWPEVRMAFDEFLAATPHLDFAHEGGKCWARKPG